MTVVEMHTAINTQLHQIDSAVLEDFLSGEIDVYLNRAQLAVLKNKVSQPSLPEEDVRTLIREDVLYPLLGRTNLPGNPVSFLVSVSGASGTLGIDIDQGGGAVAYDEAFATDVPTTVTNWLATHTATLAALPTPVIASAVSGDTSSIRITSVENLVVTDGGSVLTFTQTKEAGSQFEYLCPFPDNYYAFISGESGLTRTGNPTISVKEYVSNTRILTSGQLKRYRVTTFNKPYIREPRIFLREDFLHVLCDDETTLIDQRLVYIREPEEINLDDTDSLNNKDCELPDHIHDEVVEYALQLMSRDLNLTSPTQ